MRATFWAWRRLPAVAVREPNGIGFAAISLGVDSYSASTIRFSSTGAIGECEPR